MADIGKLAVQIVANASPALADLERMRQKTATATAGMTKDIARMVADTNAAMGKLKAPKTAADAMSHLKVGEGVRQSMQAIGNLQPGQALSQGQIKAALRTRAEYDKLAEGQTKLIGEAMAKAQTAWQQRNKLGMFSKVKFFGGAEGNASIVKEASTLASTIASQFPLLAQKAAKAHLPLVRVMKDGRQQVLKAGIFGMRYTDLNRAGGDLESGFKAKSAAMASVARAASGAGMAAGAAGAGALAVGGLLGAGALVTSKVVEDILATDRQARQLGTTVSSLRLLMLAGGEAADVMTQALEQMRQKMADFRGGQTDAIRSIRAIRELSGVNRLPAGVEAIENMARAANLLPKGFGGVEDALKKLKLPPEFAQMQAKLKEAGNVELKIPIVNRGLVDDYEWIVTSIAGITDPATRAAAAVQAFGKHAIDLLPVIGRGAEGINRARRAMQAFGMGVGEKDLESARQTAQVFRELQALGKGFMNQVGMGLSPIIAQLSKSFDLTKLFDLSGVQATVINVAEKIAQVGAFAKEAWADTSLIREGWNVALVAIESGWLRLLGKIQEGIASMFATLGEASPVFAERFKAMADLMKAYAENSRLDSIRGWREAGIQADAFGKKLAGLDAFKKVKAFFEDVRKGVGGEQIQAPAGVAEAKRIVELQQQMAGQMANLKNPWEGLQDTLARVREMDKLKMFAGNEDLKARLAAQAFQDAAGKLPAVAGPVAALQKGTRESYSAVEAFRRGEGRQTVPDLLKAILEESKRQQQEANRLLAELVKQAQKDAGPDRVPIWDEFGVGG